MHATLTRARKGGALILILAIAALAVSTGIPGSLQRAEAAYSDPANYVIGMHTPAKITKLIYPTIGNPAIVQKGTNFTIEWDPREGNFGTITTCPICTDFVVTASSTNGGAGAVACSLPVVSATRGLSTQWPPLAKGGLPDKTLYRVKVIVPYNLPADLYDLTVACTIEGHAYSDFQTNSLSAVTNFKQRFNFIQMTDVHVYGPENPDVPIVYTFSRTERVNRRTTYDASANGEGWGAMYLHKEIMEVNRLRPDFVVLTGDYDFGQRYFHKDEGAPWGDSTQYEFEQSWFYQEIQKFEVPVFVVMGNHDGYQYTTDFGAPVNGDWCTYWTHLYSPLYYSFNYGSDNKFFGVNTMSDWSSDQRSLQNYFNLILQPVKYLGAAKGAGDDWGPGISQPRLAAIDVAHLTGQLGWLRDQLYASRNCKVRVCAMHHDPWKENGSGSMWASADNANWMSQISGILDMGDGPGRLALIRLMKDYRVALTLSGHDHSDCTSEDDASKALLSWSAPGGHCIMQNTTSASFQGDAASPEYPGYRRVWIDNGQVIESGNESLNYQEPAYSWPAYALTNVGGSTNLGGLHTPALSQSWTAPPGPTTTDVTCTLTNSYIKPLTGTYMEFPMQKLSGGHYYQVDNGSLGETYDVSPTARMNQVYTNLNASQQAKAVRVHASAGVDTTAPTGSVSINGGQAETDKTAVTLTLNATDTGGSGMGEMKVADSLSGLNSVLWGQYQASFPWTLSSGNGAKTVYAKYRDRAMPGNESQVYGASINYVTVSGATIKIRSVSPSSSQRGKSLAVAITAEEGAGFVIGSSEAHFKRAGGGSELTLASTSVQNEIECTANLQIASSAIPGKYDVTVVTPNAQTAGLTGGFTVLGPTVTSVSPPSGKPGKSLSVTVSGYGTDWKAGDQVHFQSGGTDVKGITVQRTTCNSTTKLTADITIGASTPLGPCDVEVFRGAVAECGGLSRGFLVGGSDRTWYLPEGSTNGGMETWVLVQNPGDKDANITYTYMTDKGVKPGPKVKLQAHSRQTVFVADAVPNTWDVSTKVTADQDVIVERAMYGNNRQWGTDSIGITTPMYDWYLAEGCTNGGFQTWVLLLNPGGTTARAAITYMTPAGAKTGPVLTLPPYTRKSVNVADVVPNNWSVSTKVSSDQPIVVERSMYGGNTGAGNIWGHNSIGTAAPSPAWYLAEGCTNGGMETWVLVQNPSDMDAKVTLAYMTATGKVNGPAITVKAHTRQTVNVADTVRDNWSVSTMVNSDVPVIAERSMYGSGRQWGTDSIGVTTPAKDWCLAEGCTKGGMETWVLVQNPGDQPASAAITYMTDKGPVTGPTLKLDPFSRRTVFAADTVGESYNVSTRVTSDKPVIVERAVYGNNKTWATDSIGYAP